MKSRLSRLLRPACSLALAALMALPAPVLAQFGSVTVAEEKEMGRKFDETIRAQMGFVDDPEIVGYVKGVVDRVAAVLPPQPWPIKSAVVAHSSMNAFAIPGGFIYIFTGLVLGVENEAELAAVISHELGHVTERHVAKRMAQSKYINVASIAGLIAGVLLGSGGGSSGANLGKAVILGSAAGGQSAYLMYTRENEREADHVGLNYLMKAGYNPNAMPDTFEIMYKKRWFMSGDTVPTYLSTHPGLDERIGYLRDRIRLLPALVVSNEYDKSRFLRIQTLIRARATSAESALAYYEAQPKAEQTCMDMAAKGIVLDRLKRQQQAEQAFAQALACGPEDALVLREVGIFNFNQGQMVKAAAYLQKAATLNPKDVMSMFFSARIMAERKDFPGAIGLMGHVLKEVPQDSEVRYHMGRILGESGDLFGAYLNLAYSSHYGRDAKKAEYHLGRAKALAVSDVQKRQLEELQRILHPKPDKEDGKDGGSDSPGGRGGSPRDRFSPSSRLAR